MTTHKDHKPSLWEVVYLKKRRTSAFLHHPNTSYSLQEMWVKIQPSGALKNIRVPFTEGEDKLKQKFQKQDLCTYL